MFTRLAAIGLLLAGTAFAESFEDRQTKSFDFKPGSTLRFRAEYGHLEVRTGTTDKVELEAYRRVETSSREKAQEIFNDLAIESRPEAGGLAVITYFKTGWQEQDRWDWDSDHRRGPCMGGNNFTPERNDNRTYCLKYGRELRETRYIVTVPKKLNLNVETRAGHVKIMDIDGPVTARSAGGHIETGNVGGAADILTAGGHINVGDTAGPAILKTAGGHIAVGNVNGDLDANTAGGHIECKIVKGAVRAKTAGGHIDIDGADGAIAAKTVGGSIKARITGQPKAPSSIETNAGSVTVELAGNVKVDVDAESRGGSISSDFDLERRPDDSERRFFRSSSASGKINGGGPRLEVRTTHGRIRLMKTTLSF